ncbi:hypothetical protein EDM57_02775 [Brevibacillus gelatini]|uniref:Uncharacterized protein n=1 Tax=Brevibacillus gelatini TaxID=1655277 RepID=A0A3M8BBK8_9BACL|nr:hypothetical protein EDM57_02775 [Brevibacillus gelatini]
MESFAVGAALGGAFSVGTSWLAKGAERDRGALKRGASSKVEGTPKARTPKPLEPRGEPIKFVPSFKQEEIALQTYEKLRSTGLDVGELEIFLTEYRT